VSAVARVCVADWLSPRRLTIRLLMLPLAPLQRAYVTREQYDAAVERMRAGDAAAVGLWSSFESRGFADFLSFLQPLQVMLRGRGGGGGGGLQDAI
jgi:hypothetical protein